MWDFAAIAVAFMLAFALKAAGMHLALAWLASCCVVPAFLLFAEYALPDSDRSAMLPFAMFVGAIYGAAAGGVGALFASLMWKRDDKPDAGQPSRTGRGRLEREHDAAEHLAGLQVLEDRGDFGGRPRARPAWA